LNMDILGLDDNLCDIDKEICKVGNKWVYTRDIPQDLFEPYQEELAELEKLTENALSVQDMMYYKMGRADLNKLKNKYEMNDFKKLCDAYELDELQEFLLGYIDHRNSLVVAIFTNILQATTWGVEQRNEQWARYIQAVSPYYDIIITYAGSGHVDTEQAGSVPVRINKPFAVFDFYTEEQLPQESQEFYEKRDAKLSEANASTYESLHENATEEEIKKAKEMEEFIVANDISKISNSPFLYEKYILDGGKRLAAEVYLPDYSVAARRAEAKAAGVDKHLAAEREKLKKLRNNWLKNAAIPKK
ncbi:MAG: hypothetical protein IKO35_01305, partial [Elusimicrobiaceae bacterium]|nr:hypothetical protein [Elusimicrobiaceae bacterium]